MPAPVESTHALIEWLDGRQPDVAKIGGKAASLDRLAGFGFRIPPGFCLTTEAFALQVATLPGGGGHATDPAQLADAATRATVVDAMRAGPLAPAVAAALAAPLARLTTELSADPADPPRLAVRSSAIGEDGAAASYAGLHETELDLSPDDVAAAVLRCWASLWSARAIGYRTRRGLPLDDAAMAVVVQALVPADAAAVVFTRHPVTGREDQLVVTAAPRPRRRDGLGHRDAGHARRRQGLTDRDRFKPGDQPGRPGRCRDEPLAELVDLSLEVEAAFGAAVDIEAAIAGGRLVSPPGPPDHDREARDDHRRPTASRSPWVEPDDAD